jgi:hypothetical protein
MKTRAVDGLHKTNAHILFFDKEIEFRVGPGNNLKLDLLRARILSQELHWAIRELEDADERDV